MPTATETRTPTIQLGEMTIRELPSDEWHRLGAVEGGTLYGKTLSPTQTARIIVAEDASGDIVAYWVAAAMVHLDPLWVHPSHRQHPKLGLGLLGAMTHTLQQAGVGYAYAIIADADQPANGQLAEKIGFTRVPGTIYGGPIPEGDT